MNTTDTNSLADMNQTILALHMENSRLTEACDRMSNSEFDLILKYETEIKALKAQAASAPALVEDKAKLADALWYCHKGFQAIEHIIDGSQPIDTKGAAMVARHQMSVLLAALRSAGVEQ